MGAIGHLGVAACYNSIYNPGLLRVVERVSSDLLFGVDVWNLYELYWLDISGKPCVHVGRLSYDSRSKYILESKSVKLYLMSLNEHKFSSTQEAKETIVRDIEGLLNTQIEVEISELVNIERGLAIDGVCIDGVSISDVYGDGIKCFPDVYIKESLYSDVLKSNCPVTMQPDYGSLLIEYHGQKIDRSSLLFYITSLRNKNKFHEDCIQEICERILVDCKPEYLAVLGMYNRRGGIDINPIRSNVAGVFPSLYRSLRQ
ncbi:NADPH-dependent 7-cyano-7-deazaguanine reductase [Candidatus Cyrtobacter comes]|uniref:NADPH-dependent 7-cyano-7-deazaguanine reductase n=1 Tax=Candidatus Cyrtobacter comes TaxID=675776 RepID=A0ABU5L925_9RICK|nr:NADPH-dependent 7-cyano-7-deazaguanine reductase QueF [Candidatus Cyrtobacter comes]MDZ5762410.1 NADPH-dependent 7-cyano-7-deazaguanine reductase [Candidatus Cyrtobacter comes]